MSEQYLNTAVEKDHALPVKEYHIDTPLEDYDLVRSSMQLEHRSSYLSEYMRHLQYLELLLPGKSARKR